jgi:hypothetical protein
MKLRSSLILVLAIAMACAGGPSRTEEEVPVDLNGKKGVVENNKFIIYQMMTRLFGNTNTTNTFRGTLEENGVGKFEDITVAALEGIKELGVTHVWYTGVIEHMTMIDQRALGIPLDDSDVIKGRAGSPYAIKDYYDVNPFLANNPNNRMAEFEALVQRTHNQGLKVLIDFVPNHVARIYNSDAKPAGVEDFGANDDTSVAFAPNNNFFYIPGKEFKVPRRHDPLGPDMVGPLEDKFFDENPAKATGNDRFTQQPGSTDWFETVKLNYGYNTPAGEKYFDPIPDTWFKMRHILSYWVNKGWMDSAVIWPRWSLLSFGTGSSLKSRKLTPRSSLLPKSITPGPTKGTSKKENSTSSMTKWASMTRSKPLPRAEAMSLTSKMSGLRPLKSTPRCCVLWKTTMKCAWPMSSSPEPREWLRCHGGDGDPG